MNLSDSPAAVENWFEKIADKTAFTLLLDYDGTLAPFQTDPMQAVPYDGIQERLEKIAVKENHRLVIVSGRPVSDILQLMPLKGPHEIWGNHGFEYRDRERKMHPPALSDEEKAVLKKETEYLSGVSARHEIKPAGVTVHWRGLSQDEAGRLKNEFTGRWLPYREKGFKLLPFDGGLELKPAGRDKGFAVNEVLKNTESVAAYLGDDLTDEDAFRAIKGRGLAALVREKYRETEADVHIVPPVELINFLDKWETL